MKGIISLPVFLGIAAAAALFFSACDDSGADNGGDAKDAPDGTPDVVDDGAPDAPLDSPDDAPDAPDAHTDPLPDTLPDPTEDPPGDPAEDPPEDTPVDRDAADEPDAPPPPPAACEPLPPPEGDVVAVTADRASELSGIVAAAADGTTIQLETGTYSLDGNTLVFDTPGVTLRSA
ncbi:MAG: hypothetical protein ABIJ56_06690, partial [Pseudomonadota bacterium]